MPMTCAMTVTSADLFSARTALHIELLEVLATEAAATLPRSVTRLVYRELDGFTDATGLTIERYLVEAYDQAGTLIASGSEDFAAVGANAAVCELGYLLVEMRAFAGHTVSLADYR